MAVASATVAVPAPRFLRGQAQSGTQQDLEGMAAHMDPGSSPGQRGVAGGPSPQAVVIARLNAATMAASVRFIPGAT
jgi:hypothetical protein